jgi:hypothetical protein
MNTLVKNSYRAMANRTPSVRHLLIGGLLALSAITNFLLVSKVKQLQATISSLKSERSITVGMRLPPLTAEDMSGQSITIHYAETERPTLLYVFTPACGWCKKNEDNISSLASQTGDRLRIIGVALSQDGLVAYVADRFPSVNVIKPDPQTIIAYRLSGTPETILVSSHGVVLRVWKGAYADSTQRELEEYFQIKLPGLRQLS